MTRSSHEALRDTFHVADESDLGENKWLKNFQKFQRDSAPLITEIRKHFPTVSSLSELQVLGADYSAITPSLVTWLHRTDNFALKLAISELLATPAYGASSEIARAVREIAATKGEPGSEEFRERDFVLPLISQVLVRSVRKSERELLFEFAVDDSFPLFSREYFIEAMVKRKDNRSAPILERLLREARSRGYKEPIIVDFLKLLASADPQACRRIAAHLQADPSQSVRDSAVRIAERLGKK